MRLIALFNHKGGVGKTTSTFNLGWAVADLGKKVLLVDGDPQCNLTGTVLGFDGDDDFEKFYNDNPNSDINSCISPVFSSKTDGDLEGKIIPTRNKNLFIFMGHIDLANNESQLAVSISTSNALPALKNLPGSLYNLIKRIGEKNQIDYVFIDMSPSAGALNQCLLMGSDYFIIPTFPDYFCYLAVHSLAKILPRWEEEVKPFRSHDIVYSLPVDNPKFLGVISQRYRPRNKAPAASYQLWIDKIDNAVIQELIPKLKTKNMVLESDNYNLQNISDFNTLIAQSQKHNVPIFSLSDQQIEKQGTVLDVMKESRNDFLKTFQQLARTVVERTNRI